MGRFEDDEARFYGAEIVTALDHLHQMNVMYRDIKPENLLINRRGHVVLTDFGFAKVISDRTFTLCGTPEYLAPEMIQGVGHGKSVDWWALGILIFEMIAGYPPFYDSNPFGIYQKVLDGLHSHSFSNVFQYKAKSLCKQLLQPDRTKRLGCMQNGGEGVKRHKWFSHTNWVSVWKGGGGRGREGVCTDAAPPLGYRRRYMRKTRSRRIYQRWRVTTTRVATIHIRTARKVTRSRIACARTHAHMPPLSIPTLTRVPLLHSPPQTSPSPSKARKVFSSRFSRGSELEGMRAFSY